MFLKILIGDYNKIYEELIKDFLKDNFWHGFYGRIYAFFRKRVLIITFKAKAYKDK